MAHRKKSEAWVETGKKRRLPDSTRLDKAPTWFFTPPLLPFCVPFRFVLLNERLEKACDNNST